MFHWVLYGNFRQFEVEDFIVIHKSAILIWYSFFCFNTLCNCNPHMEFLPCAHYMYMDCSKCICHWPLKICAEISTESVDFLTKDFTFATLVNYTVRLNIIGRGSKRHRHHTTPLIIKVCSQFNLSLSSYLINQLK